MEDIKKFLVIDGNSIMNRAFYGIRLLSTKDGTYTNAIYGFLNIYYMMLEKLSPDYVAVSFDLSAPTFRHKIYDQYKAGRKSMPDELRVQMPIIKDIIRAMNIPILEIEGFEADDVLGTVAKNNENNNIHTYLLTGDRDSFQLVSEKTSVVIPTTKSGKTEYNIMTPAALKEKYNIFPKQVVDLKALMGDTSDNIPGVPKVGEKTAQALIEIANDLDNIYTNIDKLDISEGLRERLKEHKEQAYLSKDLATINKEVPIEINYDLLKLTDVNLPEISRIFTRLSFKKFLDKYITDENELDVETTTTKDFFKELNTTNFINILSNEELIEILNKLEDRDISFTYLDNAFSYDAFKNTLVFYETKNIYLFKMSFSTQEGLKAFCSCKVNKIGYNTKKILKLAFDANAQEINEFNEDIMIEYYLINPTDNNYTIENISYNVIDVTFPELDVQAKKTIQTNIFDMLDIDLESTVQELSNSEKKYLYAYMNVIKKSNIVLNKKLEELSLVKLYKEIEIPLIETLANMESNGMYVNIEKLKQFGEYLDIRISEITRIIYNLAGEDFNINSTSQLGCILFEKLGLPHYKKTKNSYSTDKEVLEDLIDKHEIISYILEYRSLTKLKSTYVDGLLNVIGADGRIHTTFMQAVTATGRLSSVDPNLQNIPVRTELGSRIRECFTVQSDKNVIIDADYNQIELRILAHMSNDENMIAGFNSGKDIHTITAAQVFNLKLGEVTKDMRGKAKAVNFGIVYGISDYGLAKNIGVKREDAKKYISSYLNHYIGVDKYMKSLIESATETGYVTSMYGRRRKVDELKSANYNTRMFGQRVAMNMPIQGTAADIIKVAMNKLYYKIKESGLNAKLIMQVHDELIVEAPKEEREEVINIMKDAMENVIDLKVKLTVEIDTGESWMDAK